MCLDLRRCWCLFWEARQSCRFRNWFIHWMYVSPSPDVAGNAKLTSGNSCSHTHTRGFVENTHMHLEWTVEVYLNITVIISGWVSWKRSRTRPGHISQNIFSFILHEEHVAWFRNIMYVCVCVCVYKYIYNYIFLCIFTTVEFFSHKWFNYIFKSILYGSNYNLRYIKVVIKYINKYI